MTVALLELDLSIPGARSLKEKRMALRSLKDRLRRTFNVAVAETDFQDVWQSAEIGVVTVSTDARAANRLLSRVVEHVEHSHPDVVIDDYRIQFL